MMKIYDFKNLKLINSQKYIDTYIGTNIKNHILCLIKFLKSEYPTVDEIEQLKQEQELIRLLYTEEKLKVSNIKRTEKNYLFVLEGIDPMTLMELSIKEFPLKIEKFLKIAINLAETVSNLHKKGYIHKSLNAENLVIDKATKDIFIIDYSKAIYHNRSKTSKSDLEFKKNELPYLSPEATGRLSVGADFRSDIYSIGVILYELIAGKISIEEEELMVWVHSHLTKKIIPPEDINPSIPRAISDIIMKCLEKDVKERYQSVAALKIDLMECEKQYLAYGIISAFILAKQDVSHDFKISKNIYSREKEFLEISKMFERVKEGEQLNLVISGSPGVGKTSLVKEFLKKKAKDIYFMKAKFDSLKSEIPYIQLIEAFNGFIDYLLTLDKVQIQNLRNLILKNLGVRVAILKELIPKIEHIIGRQKTEQNCYTKDTEKIFFDTFMDLIQVFASLGDPLIIFLDDIQWIDKASLKLMEGIMKSSIGNLFLILSYRDEKTEDNLKLKDLIKNLSKDVENIEYIKLKPMTLQDVNTLVEDSLGREYPWSLGLCRYLYEKTGGNPFALKDMLYTLYDLDFLKYDFYTGCWEFYMDRLESFNIEDNLVYFIVNKLSKFSDNIIRIIKYASCMGVSFKAESLRQIFKENRESFYNYLEGFIREGILYRSGDLFKFAHDKVHNAVYSSISNEERVLIHREIGKFFYGKMGCIDSNQDFFEMVNQFNMGKAMIRDKREKYDLAKLNLQAGEKAKKQMAFQSAGNYFNKGAELLDKDAWEGEYKLTLSLFSELCELNYYENCNDKAEVILSDILKHVKSPIHRAKARLIKINAYVNQNRDEEVVDLAIEAFKALGYYLPKKPSNLRVIFEILLTRFYCSNKNMNKGIKHKEIIDEKELVMLEILLATGFSMFVQNPKLIVVNSSRGCRYSIKEGVNIYTPNSFIAYATMLNVLLKDYKKAFKIGEYAIKLSEEYGDNFSNTSAYCIFSGFIQFPLEPFTKCEENLIKAIGYGYNCGNYIYLSYAISFYINFMSLRGATLGEIKYKIEEFSYNNKKIKDIHVEKFLKIYKGFILELQEKWISPKNHLEEEGIFGEIYEIGEKREQILLVDYHLCKIRLLYYKGEYHKAIEESKKAIKYENMVKGHISILEIKFYYSLSITCIYERLNIKEKIKYLKVLNKEIRNLKILQKSCPENFKHKYGILYAELCRIKGRKHKADEFYEMAVKSAGENNFIQDQAIALELAGKFFNTLGFQERSKSYIWSAYKCYEQWGAKAKVNKLAEEYPYLKELKASSEKDVFLSKIDMNTILKTFHALAEEINIQQLLKKIITIVMQNAGATRCILALEKNEELYIEAKGEIEIDEIKIETFKSMPLKSSQLIDSSIINYLTRTGKTIVSGNLQDMYMLNYGFKVMNKGIKSMMCLPIIHNSIFKGIIYLENNLINNAFTSNQIEILKVLCSQLYISIENAYLYSNLQNLNEKLEEKVRERTEHLENSQKEAAKVLVEKSVLEERTRIAREIHDTVGHTLTSINVQIEVAKRLIRKEPELAAENLELSQEQVRDGLSNIRKSLKMLREGNYSEEFIPSMESFIEKTMRYTGIKIDYQISILPKLSPTERYVLYRALQEGITNGIRHGGSNCFYFKLGVDGDCIVFLLKDYGKGRDKINLGFGLEAMNDRVKEIGGVLLIESKEGKGCTLRINIPIKNR